jgi:chaperone required for assembly of F1-ATPase
MRDLLEDLNQVEPANPMEAARRNMRPALRKRFYEAATAGEAADEGFPVLLDARPIRTPARRLLAAPRRPLAEAIAAEWDAQRDEIDPARMPLTRLANTIVDGVCDVRVEVTAEIVKYLGSDLLFYRADQPEGLIAAQAGLWDPVLAWAREVFGARFMLSEGVMHVTQPERAIEAARIAIHEDAWRLGAVHAVTTLTGSALLALALALGRITVEEAWAAAHVDEDWQMAQWGRDEQALDRRAFRWDEMRAAATVLGLLR